MAKRILLISLIVTMVLGFSVGCSTNKGPLGPLHSMSCSKPPPLGITITPDPSVMKQEVKFAISVSDKKVTEIQILDSTGKRIRYYSDYDVSSPDRTGPVMDYSGKELHWTETFTTGTPGKWTIKSRDLGMQSLTQTFTVDAAK